MTTGVACPCWQHAQAVAVGQPQVEHQRTEARGRERRERSFGVAHPVDDVAFLTQPIAHRLTQHVVVFDEKNAHRGSSSSGH